MSTKATLYLCLCLSILSGCTQVHYQVVKTGHEGQPIPSVDLISADSSHYLNTKDILPGPPVVFLYFRPDCPFCQSEITEILQHLSSLHGARFYLVASDTSNILQTFYKNVERRHILNFFVGIDYKNTFQHYFNPEAVPYTAIYRSNRTLSKAYLGALSGTQIAKALD